MLENSKEFGMIQAALFKIGLSFNEKTVCLTKNEDIDRGFGNQKIEVVDQAKILGRTIKVIEGTIIGSNKCYYSQCDNVKTIPVWILLGIRRLIFNGAINAKLRYVSFYWSFSDIKMRSKIFTKAFKFFRIAQDKKSYVFILRLIENQFRFYIDLLNLEKIIKDYTEIFNGTKYDENGRYGNQILYKLQTGVKVLDHLLHNDFDIYRKDDSAPLWKAWAF